MKRLVITLFTLFSLLTFNQMTFADQSLDSIVAVVNKDIITESQLNNEISLYKKQANFLGQKLPDDATIKKNMLEQLINQTLQLQIAKQDHLTVQDADVEHAIENIAQSNKMTVKQFQDKLKQDGINFDNYRKKLAEQILISEVQERVLAEKIKLTQSEINQVIQQLKNQEIVHIAAVMIPVPENADMDTLQQANQLAEQAREQLQQGSDVVSTAIRLATNQFPVQGNDLGWRDSEHLPAFIANELVNAEPNTVTQPIETAQGVYVFKVLDVKKQAALPKVQQVHYRQIEIAENNKISAADAQKLAFDLSRQLQHGADFKKLAKTYSTDKISAKRGGDAGWVDETKLSNTLQQTLQSLKPNQISLPIQDGNRWLIVQMLGQRQFDDSNAYYAAQAKQILYQQKADAVLGEWLQELRKDSFIKIS